MLREIPKDWEDNAGNDWSDEEGEDDDLEFDGDDVDAIDSERIERAVVRYFRAHPPVTPEDITDAIENHFMQMDVEEIVAEARRDNWNDAEEAQELMFEMMTMSPEDEWDEMAALAKRALALDPDNADAGMLLATQTGKDLDEIEARLRDVVARAERALGSDIEEGRGALWLNALTRPYLRARYTLMATLRCAERWEDAIEEANAMLELNEDDDQDVSLTLMGLYLAVGDTRSARRIMKEYIDEDSAIYEWASVLDKFLSGNKSGAKKALATAMRNNPYTADYLLDQQAVVGVEMDPDEPGSPEEAADCVEIIGYAWAAHPEALDWLDKMAGQNTN